jgi:hypothetical protein
VRNQQKTISVEEKLDVISRLGNGEQIVDIYCNVRLAYSVDNAGRITGCAKSGTKVSAKRTYSRISIVECIEKVLSTWIQDQDQCRMPIIRGSVQS